MNKNKFNFLPEYINKQSRVTRSEKRVQIITTGIIGDIIKSEYNKPNNWFLYFKDKYDLEHDGLFWSKPSFDLKVIFPVNLKFKSLNMRIALPSVEDNKLSVTSNDKVIFETSRTDDHFDVEIPYATAYTFQSKSMIPKNDNRELGIYITEISIVDLDFNKNIIPYNHLMQFTLNEIIPVSVCQK